ncbi:MAG: hypothetical protein AAFY41_06030 [Bacteroidota bacterium]
MKFLVAFVIMSVFHNVCASTIGTGVRYNGLYHGIEVRDYLEILSYSLSHVSSVNVLPLPKNVYLEIKHTQVEG